MRLLVIVLTILLFLGLLGLVLTNLETVVSVRIFQTVYPDVPLFVVVFLSVLAGILYAGIIAVAEGANLRFANHRLTREVQKLETELNYLRTQPLGRPRPEPDAVEAAAEPGAEAAAEEGGSDTPPSSAPVYDGDGWTSDDEDYSGGRAV